jgi:putative ABC transport system substrate-binding protein
MGHVRRRQLLIAAGAILAVPLRAAAQPRRVYRIGYPAISPLAGLKHFSGPLEQGLRDHGYTPGKDVVIDTRSGEGSIDRYTEVVQEMVRTKPDVIMAGPNTTITVIKAATQTIPIVMVVGTDVVGAGYVKSLARPGGNITGMTSDVGAEIVAKRLQLLREVAPKISRIAILSEPPERGGYRHALENAASVLGVSTFWLEYSGDLERDFSEMLRWRADAVFHLTGPRGYGRRAEIIALEAKHRLPAVYSLFEITDAGGLMSYGPSITGAWRAAARYVDKIFKGAKPGDLPVEQPTTFYLVINLKTAKTLELAIPQTILLRADRVIE